MGILLRNGTVIDGTGAVLEHAQVYVEGATVKALGREPDLPQMDTETTVIDVQGGTILPGLMNLHTHLQRRHLHRQTTGALYRIETPRLEALPDEQRIVWAIKNLWAELLEGTTTQRDTASGNALANKIRWVFNSGLFNGPRLISCGEGIAITGGHGAHYDKLGSLMADGTDEVRKAVRQQLFLGADWIKMMASAGLAGMPDYENPRFTELSCEEMQAGVREAHARGVRVCAHAMQSESIQNAICAGVDCIEHGAKLDEETVTMMVKAGTFYVPTMSGVYNYYKREEAAGNRQVADLVWELVIGPHPESVAMAYRAGVRIATGTDTLGQIVQEIEMLHAAGIPKMDCLRAATAVAAEVLGLQNEVGTLEPGKCADILVVRGDPLADLGALRNVTHVFKSGNLVTPAWLVGSVEEAMAQPFLNANRPFYRRESESHPLSRKQGQVRSHK